MVSEIIRYEKAGEEIQGKKDRARGTRPTSRCNKPECLRVGSFVDLHRQLAQLLVGGFFFVERLL